MYILYLRVILNVYRYVSYKKPQTTTLFIPIKITSDFTEFEYHDNIALSLYTLNSLYNYHHFGGVEQTLFHTVY